MPLVGAVVTPLVGAVVTPLIGAVTAPPLCDVVFGAAMMPLVGAVVLGAVVILMMGAVVTPLIGAVVTPLVDVVLIFGTVVIEVAGVMWQSTVEVAELLKPPVWAQLFQFPLAVAAFLLREHDNIFISNFLLKCFT